MRASRAADSDVIEVGDLVGRVRRRWRWLAGGTLLGIAVAVAAILVVPRQYESVSRVLVRADNAAPTLMTQLGSLAGVFPGMSGGSGLQTEIVLMSSAPVLEGVVDSVGLQASVVSPRGVHANQLFASARFVREIETPTSYLFRREGARYRVTGPGFAGSVAPGGRLTLPVGVVELRRRGLPPEFTVAALDMRDALAALRGALELKEASQDVVELAYRAPDPQVTARVLNVLVDRYLRFRTSTDRGENRHRYLFLEAQTDSIRSELARAEDALRGQQENAGFVDPETYGGGEYKQALALRAESETLEVETRALRSLLSRGTAGADQLAAYPTFLRNPAINALLNRLTELRTKRLQLLETRTEADPEVLTTDATIRSLETQMLELSRSYLAGLERQAAEIRQQMGRYESVLSGLPAQAQQSFRLQREVRRLSETLVALQSQSVQTRLAAVGEGGKVRQIDPPVVPRHPISPRPRMFLLLGALGGVLLGLVAGLVRSYTDPRVRSLADAALASGVPALRFDPRAPLLLGGEVTGALLVAPGAGRAPTGEVARRVAGTASLQGRAVALLDLTADAVETPRPALARVAAHDGSSAAPAGGEGYAVFAGASSVGARAPTELRAVVEDMERRYDLVVVSLGALDAPAAVALLSPERRVVLVARAGEALRNQLHASVADLRQAGVDTAGVVLLDSAEHERRRA